MYKGSLCITSFNCMCIYSCLNRNKQTKIKTTINKRKRQARLGGRIYKLFHKGSYLENMNNPLQLYKKTPQLKTSKGFK